jgi:hypothetical protein
LAAAVAARGQEVVEEFLDDFTSGGAQGLRVCCRLSGGREPGELHRRGEGDPVGIDLALFGCVDFERGQGLVDGEECVDLLADELGGLGAQDEAGASQPVFEFGEAVLDLQRWW